MGTSTSTSTSISQEKCEEDIKTKNNKRKLDHNHSPNDKEAQKKKHNNKQDIPSIDSLYSRRYPYTIDRPRPLIHIAASLYGSFQRYTNGAIKAATEINNFHDNRLKLQFHIFYDDSVPIHIIKRLVALNVHVINMTNHKIKGKERRAFWRFLTFDMFPYNPVIIVDLDQNETNALLQQRSILYNNITFSFPDVVRLISFLSSHKPYVFTSLVDWTHNDMKIDISGCLFGGVNISSGLIQKQIEEFLSFTPCLSKPSNKHHDVAKRYINAYGLDEIWLSYIWLPGLPEDSVIEKLYFPC